MRIGLFLRQGELQPLAIEYFLERRKSGCITKARGWLGRFWGRQLREWGVEYVQRPPGFGVVQVFPEDGRRFLEGLFLQRSLRRYLNVQALDAEATRLNQQLVEQSSQTPSSKGVQQFRRDRLRSSDLVLRQDTLSRRVPRSGIIQKAQMRALRRMIPRQRTKYVLAVPRFCSDDWPSPPSDGGPPPGPGKAEMVFDSERDAFRAFLIRLTKLNKPAPDHLRSMMKAMSLRKAKGGHR